MAEEFSLVGFAEFLAEVTAATIEQKHHALEKAATIIETEAKRVIGTYDYGWPQLAQSTQDERVSLGYPANEPLLREGDMRASIEHTVKALDGEADIGSNSDIAVYQELGTGTIPPRPFLAGAAAHKADEVAQVIGKEMVAQVLEGALIGAVLPKP